MGYGAIEYEPFTSIQAHLKIHEVEEVDGKFEDTPKQVKCEFEVLGYEESDDDDGAWIGHKFSDWFGFSVDKHGNIGISKSPKAKLRNLINGTLGLQVIDNATFEPNKLLNQEIRSQVVRSGKNQDGTHSRIKGETIMPKPKKKRGDSSDADLEGVDVESLDMEPPDFFNLEGEKAS